MSLLLDTHVWIWSQVEPHRIGRKAMRRLEKAGERLFVATISSLEIARLVQVGLLEINGELEAWIRDSLEALQGSSIGLSHQAAIGAYQLPGSFHKDPADRVLVAIAREHQLTLVTADERILNYGHVKTLNATS